MFAKLGVFQAPARLFSATAEEPVSPVWQNTDPASTYFRSVAAAADADIYVSAHDVSVPGSPGLRNVIVQCYTSTSSAPVWSYTFPDTTNGHENFSVRVSRDGQRIVALFDNIWTFREDVKVFQPSSSTPIASWSVPMLGSFTRWDLSTDGRVLALASQAKISVLDLVTGAVTWNNTLFETLYGGFALAGDGSALGYGLFGGYRVFRRTSTGTYEERLFRGQPGWVCDRMDMSDDGSTLVAASNDTSNLRTIKLETLNLPATLQQSQAVLLATSLISTVGSAYPNTVQDIELSRNGRTLAVGVSGDGGGSSPEVVVYRDFAVAPWRTLDLPGSVFDVSMSGDGRHLAVASKLQHHTVFSSGGRLDMLELGTGDLTLCGQPRIGTTVQLDVAAPAAAMTFVLSANGLAETPTEFPQMGSLYLPRAGVMISPAGAADATGHARLDVTIPHDANLIGRDVFYQGFRTNPRRLTQDWVQMTILP